MPRTIPRLSLSLVLLACAGAAGAQTSTPPQPQPRPQSQPPATEPIEAGSDEPATRIEPRRGTEIREKRNNNGQVTEIEVKSGKSRYIMRPNQAAGNAQAGDAQSSAFRAPQWQVMEFDGNAKKKAQAEAQAAAEAAAAAGSGAAAKKVSTPATGAPAKVPPATAPMLSPADVPPPPPLPASR
ncbi:hypothetical protein [Massilia sp. GCM10023247]|uniref:hypothetical protein n=1 Tax=Massilia sp. GCM10023247 TaxID=3252643 RepID=UPI003612A3CE